MLKTEFTPAQHQQEWIDDDSPELHITGPPGYGKSMGLLFGALKHIEDPNYRAVIFKKSYLYLAQPCSIMHMALQVIGDRAIWNERCRTFVFPSGAALRFDYMETERERWNQAGSLNDFVGFDHITDFQEDDYHFMYSRMRRYEGHVEPRIWSTSTTGYPEEFPEWVSDRFFDLPAVYSPGADWK